MTNESWQGGAPNSPPQGGSFSQQPPHGQVGQPPGYGPQNYPQQGYPQQGYSNGPGAAPQGQAFGAYGATEQYPPGQQGWNQQYSGYGGPTPQPPKKSYVPIIVAALAVLAALFMGGVLWGVLNSDQTTESPPPATPQATPSKNDGNVTDPPKDPAPVTPVPSEPSGGESPGQQPPPGNVPPLPAKVGDFTADEQFATNQLTMYINDDYDSINVIVGDSELNEEQLQSLDNRRKIGVWECGEDLGGGVTCLTSAHGRATAIMDQFATFSEPELIAWGDELLRLWK